MSLEEFDTAEVREGHLYELGRGVIIVSDVPGKKHLAQVNALRRLLARYDLSNPDRIHTIAGGAECKVLVPPLGSERHPDLAVYASPPPEGEDIWRTWVPGVVIEVISRDSEKRDYEEKPAEYLAFGVNEYWIFDADKSRVGAMRRAGGRWAERVLGPADVIKTDLLPGLELRVAAVFDAARHA